MENENIPTHLVTIPVTSAVDPAELLDIMMEIREHIIEMVEQQCIECFIDADEIAVETKNEGGE
jgi:hypothetical protein